MAQTSDSWGAAADLNTPVQRPAQRVRCHRWLGSDSCRKAECPFPAVGDSVQCTPDATEKRGKELTQN